MGAQMASRMPSVTMLSPAEKRASPPALVVRTAVPDWRT